MFRLWRYRKRWALLGNSILRGEESRKIRREHTGWRNFATERGAAKSLTALKKQNAL